MSGAPRLIPGLMAVAAAAALAFAGPSSHARAADLPRHGTTVLDTIAPTAPHGFAADLPRSPLADVLVNGGLRFASAAEAQRHCPRDDVVRVETFSNLYRPASAPGSGDFMCKAAALQEGDRAR